VRLQQRLNNCNPGASGWRDYENICTDIFQFLFKDDFRHLIYQTQSYTHDGIFRRDMVINNNYTDPTGIWARAKTDFNANVIIVDFKNYEKPLEQNDFYLPSKYLNNTSGKFGIVICRRGLSASAKTLQRRMLHHDQELLLAITDDDLKGMISEKMARQDPTYRLENQVFTLYQSV
jgi:hypothetical protein